MNKYFPELLFVEDTHTYFVNGTPLNHSVSFFLKQLSNSFDSDKMSQIVANKRGITKEQVLEEWSTINKTACDDGTAIHLFGERYAIDRSLKPTNGKEEAIVKFFGDLPEHIIVFAIELEMYHKEYMFGGTADLILYDTKNNELYICDWKTNKDLFKNFKEQTLLKPFNDLLDNPINKYQMQLSIYQIMLEQIITDIPITRRIIIWLKPDGNYEMYDAKDYRERLKDYLKDYYK